MESFDSELVEFLCEEYCDFAFKFDFNFNGHINKVFGYYESDNGSLFLALRLLIHEGVYHSKKEPALIMFNENGYVVDIKWYVNGQNKRPCDYHYPTNIHYYDDKPEQLCAILYYDEKGLDHNLNGMAIAQYTESGELGYHKYAVNGKDYKKDRAAWLKNTRVAQYHRELKNKNPIVTDVSF